MPYKYNDKKRHKFDKPKYKVTNWSEYEKSLIRRGSLTIWFTEEARKAWHPEKKTKVPWWSNNLFRYSY